MLDLLGLRLMGERVSDFVMLLLLADAAGGDNTSTLSFSAATLRGVPRVGSSSSLSSTTSGVGLAEFATTVVGLSRHRLTCAL